MATQPSLTEDPVAADLGNNVIPLQNFTLCPHAPSRYVRRNEKDLATKNRPSRSILALAAALTLAFASPFALAYPPTYFTFTPHFKDPDPGKRIWEKKPPGYVETLPSGRKNTFRIQKETTVHGQRGLILQKVEEPNFLVFIADGDASRMDLWWWRDKGPWNYMGGMDNVSAPHNID